MLPDELFRKTPKSKRMRSVAAIVTTVDEATTRVTLLFDCLRASADDDTSTDRDAWIFPFDAVSA